MVKVQPMENMNANMEEVVRLTEIHSSLTGTGRGRRYRVEVLNKSAIVLITACWEALVEDIASDGFDFLVTQTKDPKIIPAKVRALAGKPLREANDHTKVWNLAGDGWKRVLRNHRNKTIERLVGSLNTPRAGNVDRMFKELLGIDRVSASWGWGTMDADKARQKLDAYVTLRGNIAHRVSTSGSVTKATVNSYREFAYRIAVKTSNRVNTHISTLVGKNPWDTWYFRSVS